MIPVQSRIIEFDWLKLANVLEELEPSQSGKLQIKFFFQEGLPLKAAANVASEFFSQF